MTRYTEYVPVNLEKIARDHKLAVKYDFIGGNNSGKIEKINSNNSQNGYTHKITHNILHPDNRNRFTFAHELGHFFLHSEQMGNSVVDDILFRSKLSSDLETEANTFAADILMPKKKVLEHIDAYIKKHDLEEPLRYSINNKIADLREMVSEFALRYKVSEHAMSIRLGLSGII